MTVNPWLQIWQKKGLAGKTAPDLPELIAIDGFDTGAGVFPLPSWLAYVDKIVKKLELRDGCRILEIGCGAGAFLYPIAEQFPAGEICGIDYSANLLEICRRVIPRGNFQIAEANAVPFADTHFDAVVSNGVFFYFSSLDYAGKVVREIGRVLKPGGRAAILDLNDAAKKTQYEEIRRAKLGKEKYEELYKGLKHLFFDKRQFAATAAQYGMACEITDQDIPEYANSHYRFNAFLRKTGK